MNILQIENSISDLMNSFDEAAFIYDFLLAYDTPKSIIKRLKDGGLNLSKTAGEVLWKKKIFFKVTAEADLHLEINRLKSEPGIVSHSPRFIVLTDYGQLLAIDTKNQDTLVIPFLDLAKHFTFFLPLAGMEKAQFKIENPADVKAAEKMAKLYDEINKDNPATTSEEVHGLNVFLSRLLFCFFAEDTEIFNQGRFTNAIKSHTQADGSDLTDYLERLFRVLNTDYPDRGELPDHLAKFPYVNGGLFREEYAIPVFSFKSRNAIIECGELNWKDINPDIFGSMIQAVVTPEHRGGLGMHYTSVPNIMKVIEPLFLNELYQEFENNQHQPQKLENLLYRLSKLKIFDPACGSGNFLIIAYKELRFLEIKIIQRLEQLNQAVTGFEEKQLALIPKAQQSLAAMYQRKLFSNIQLSQFYGIELDDFAHEVAMLSLWLAQHQMNMKFKEQFGQSNPTLPLKDGGNITHGNATRLNWEVICPKRPGDEIYVMGNPPYKGKKEQTKEQKSDLKFSCGHLNSFKNLDFIACWFVIVSKYITTEKIKCAFVTTNSICQGEQVGMLWPPVFNRNVEIFFAYTSFMWKNNAKQNAGVAVAIIGLQRAQKNVKHLFVSSEKKTARVIATSKISPYLSIGSDTIVKKRTKPLSILSSICNGSMANDNTYFFLDPKQYELLQPDLKKFYKKVIGAKEFFHGIDRYTLWLDQGNLDAASQYVEIQNIIQKVKDYRLKSTRLATRKLAEFPYRYGEVRYVPGNALLIPGLSAEKREYIPLGFINDDTIVTNLCQVVYHGEPWLFGLLSSKMNNLWVKSTSGYFKKDIRYSPVLSYNTLPFKEASLLQKQEIEKNVYRILEERELHSERTIAKLYDPNKMPESLKAAHRELDMSVERCYRSKPFESDEERLEFLFKLYEQMVAEEKTRGTLFNSAKKIKK